MAAKHTVKSYDQDLAQLNRTILEMGGLVEANLASALEALVTRDTKKALDVTRVDDRLDRLENAVEALVTRLIARRQPMAVDLREITSALVMSSDLERMGDLAATIARHTILLTELTQDDVVRAVSRMGAMVTERVKEVLDAYVQRDAAKALAIRSRDEEVDQMFANLFDEVVERMKSSRDEIEDLTQLLFVVKSLERIGDHVKNLAEMINYMVRGEQVRHDRGAVAASGGGGKR